MSTPWTKGPSDLTAIEVLELICDLASQEWQESDGKRRGAVDNSGNRLWFISDDLMRDARATLARVTGEGK